MHIAFDARALAWAGIGTYTRNLLQQFALAPAHYSFTVLLTAADVPLFNAAIPAAQRERFTCVLIDDSYYSWREHVLLPLQLARVRADVFHFTNFNVPLYFPRPYVVTIHDITRFIFPGQTQQLLRQQVMYELVFTRAVAKARAIITVSHTTQQELTTLPVIVPRLSRVVYEGVDAVFEQPPSPDSRQRVRMLLGTRDPYLLYVGVWMNHKNIRRLLEAFAAIAPQFPHYKFVLTGKPKPGYTNVVHIAQQLGITDRLIFAGFVPQHLLSALYSEAKIFLFASLYEGFGLPPLEAMACGTPVVASNVSSLPELLGNAVVYVNPEYVPGIVAALRSLLRDGAHWADISARGRMQALQYRWSDAAEQHLAVYRSAISE